MEASLDSILAEATTALRRVSVLRHKAARLSGYLGRIKAEVPRIRTLTARRVDHVEVEELLLKVLHSSSQLESLDSERGLLAAFAASRSQARLLDEYHQDLVLLLEPGLATEGGGAAYIDRVLQRLRAEQRRDNELDVDADTKTLRESLEIVRSIGALKESASALERAFRGLAGRQVDEKLKNTEKLRQSLDQLALAALEMADVDLANIAPGDLAVDDRQPLGTTPFGPVVAGVWSARRVAVLRVAIRPGSLVSQDAVRKQVARWRKLDHPNLISVLGTCARPGRGLDIVMQCGDITLHDVLHRSGAQALSSEQAEAVMRGTARAMHYLHTHNVVHGGVRPCNIWVSCDLGRVQLAPFASDDDQPENTRAAFLAPECSAQPARWTSRADVFAFGMTCWEILHGECAHRVPGPPKFSDDLTVKIWLKRLVEATWDRDIRRRPYSSEVVRVLEQRSDPRKSSRLIQSIVGWLRPASLPRRVSRSDEPSFRVALRPELTRAASAPSLGEALEDVVVAPDAARAVPARPGRSARDALPPPGHRSASREREVASARARHARNRSRSGITSTGKLRSGGHLANPEGASKLSERGDSGDPGLSGGSASESGSSDEEGELDSNQTAKMRDEKLRNSQGRVPPKLPPRPRGRSRERHNLPWRGASADQAHVSQRSMKKDGADRLRVALQTLRGLETTADVAALSLPLENIAEVLTDSHVVVDIRDAPELLWAIRESVESEQAQRWALVVVRALALGAPGNRTALLDAGAHRHILDAMRMHIDVASIQGNGCVALYVLVLASDGQVDARSQGLLMSAGACSDVLQAMHVHRDNAKVQVNACWALVGLANSNAGVQSELLRADAPRKVIRTMQVHRDDPRVLENAAGALWNMMERSPACQKAVLAAAGHVALVRALKAHKSDARLVENVLGCLRCVAEGNPTKKVRLATSRKLGLPKAMVAALREHRGNEDLQVQLFELAAVLAKGSPLAQHRLVSRGLLNEAEEIHRIHSRSSRATTASATSLLRTSTRLNRSLTNYRSSLVSVASSSATDLSTESRVVGVINKFLAVVLNDHAL